MVMYFLFFVIYYYLAQKKYDTKWLKREKKKKGIKIINDLGVLDSTGN